MNYKSKPHLGQELEISIIKKPQFSHLKIGSFSNLARSCIEIHKKLEYLMIMQLKEVVK